MNKSVKKALAIAVALCLAFAMVACSGGGSDSKESKFVGTWKATTIDANGTQFNPADSGAEMTMEFKADGKVTINMSGEEPEELTWKEKDGGVEMDDGGEAIVGKMDGEKLVVELPAQGIKFILEKQ